MHPLFINEQETINQSSNENIEALRSLLYDEEPDAIAKNLL